MISTKAAKSFLFNTLMDSMPSWSPIKKQASPWPYVVGAIGLAAVGGIAAVMIFSPKTRVKALGMAKNTYGKVTEQLDELGVAEKLGFEHQNGIAKHQHDGIQDHA